MSKTHYKVVLDVFVNADENVNPHPALEQTFLSSAQLICDSFGPDEEVRIEDIKIDSINCVDSR